MATMIEVFTEAFRAGEVRARREGRLEGEARMIVRLAAGRFGPETAQHLSRSLSGVTDPDQMDRVAEAVIDGTDGRECLARVGALLQAGQS